jgi:DNA invertase Pin-like site-specific DNA recombinase
MTSGSAICALVSTRPRRDLLNVLDQGKRGAGFKSLKDTWADTTTAHGRLMLTVLGGLAEFEREVIRARTGEGRKRAKERAVKFGRNSFDRSIDRVHLLLGSENSH